MRDSTAAGRPYMAVNKISLMKNEMSENGHLEFSQGVHSKLVEILGACRGYWNTNAHKWSKYRKSIIFQI